MIELIMRFPTFQLANTQQYTLFTAHDKVITFHHLTPPLAPPNFDLSTWLQIEINK